MITYNDKQGLIDDCLSWFKNTVGEAVDYGISDAFDLAQGWFSGRGLDHCTATELAAEVRDRWDGTRT
jgi:hypothetical protein